MGKRWQGWPAASALGKHGDTDDQLVSVLGKRAGGECQEVQHWRNTGEGKAISFSNGKTWWQGWATASALVKYDGSDETVTSALVKHDRRGSQLLQQ